MTSEAIGSLRGHFFLINIHSSGTNSQYRISCPCLLHSLVVEVLDIGARGPRLNSHLWYSNEVRILKSNSFANHILVHYMLIGSTQVLQGHCPLVLLKLVACRCLRRALQSETFCNMLLWLYIKANADSMHQLKRTLAQT